MAGPFSLTAQSTFRAAPKFSIAGAPGEGRPNTNPGPGEYKPIRSDQDKFAKSASWTMSGSLRGFGARSIKQPGPGAYTTESVNMTPKWGFHGERLKQGNAMSTPGPGHYTWRAQSEGQLSSMTSRPEGTKRAATPGPGQYHPGLAPSSSTPPQISFGSSRPSPLHSKTPGPGAYDHEMFSNTQKSVPKYSIKGKFRPPAPEMTPGPIGTHTSFK